MWLASLPTLALVSACDRNSPTDPVDEHGEPVGMELLDQATGERLAWTHGTGASIHWDGGLPHLDEGDEMAVAARFLDAEGREIPLGGEFELRATLAPGATSGVVALTNHGDHVDIEALEEGEAQLVFQLFHGGHSDWDSPPIAVEVEGHNDGVGQVVGAELIDRASGERLAWTDGTGADIHWDGGLPHLHVGDELAVNVRFLDAEGNAVTLGGDSDFSVRAGLAEGAAEGIVELADHGDHVDIEAMGAGETEVVFSLWHDGHSDFDAPAIEVEVEPETGDAGDISRVEIINRDTGEEILHTDGTGDDMVWDGTFPHLHPGEEIEVNVVFKDSQGRVVELGGEFTVEANLTEDSAEGVIALASHGDHVDIEAEAVGEVKVIFSLMHGDHADFDAPPLDIEVDED
ncbi:MAG: hypothetical protein WEA09_10985 [Gemmatimonadota bacterium]